MIRNNIISVLRNLWKNKTSTLVIVFSIGVAISACMLLFKYVNFQLSFDKFNEKAERIYRIPYKKTVDGFVEFNSAANVTALAPWLKENFPEVEDAVRINSQETDLIFKYPDKSGGIHSIENRITWVDTNFCNLFPIEFIFGNCESAFNKQMAINISESFSKKMFGDENPLGKKLLLYAYKQTYEIVGVYKDFPQNSHFNFDVLMTYEHTSNLQMYNSWIITRAHTYVLLKENVSRKIFQEKLNKSLKGELGRLLTECIIDHYPEAKNYEEQIAMHKFEYDFTLEPLSQLNFSLRNREFKMHKEKRMIIFLLAISILILLIAWINYFNLAVVKMLENVANSQIRKVIGANKMQLFILLITESIIINLFGFILAQFIYRSVYNVFIKLSNIPSEMNPFSYFFEGTSNLFTFIIIISVLFLISILVPLILPFIRLFIKNRHFSIDHTVPYRNTKTGLKSTMVVVQFILSVFMIASTLTMNKQMNYMNKKELGFNPEQIFTIKSPQAINKVFFEKYKPFHDEIGKNPLITNYSEATSVPPIELSQCGIKLNHNSEKFLFRYIFHNSDYFDFFNIDIIAGENYTIGCEFMDSLNRKVILNETACKHLGFDSPEDAIGQSMIILKTWFQEFNAHFPGGKAKIIGVCSDYYHNSVRQEKQPTMFFQIPEAKCLPYFCFKFKAESSKEVLVFITEKWKEYFPDFPLTNYFFLDKKFQNEYEADKRFGIMSGIFSFLAVLLACTGLFMLSSFNILKRIKEVGIRKSNGASSLQIIILFVKKFLYLILIAYAISAPLSYFIMNKWLQNYPYRITLGLWFFLIPLALITIITMGTILYQVYIAARTNPVETLRYE